MFKSNNCVAIHLTNITAAENFYTNVMKFTLLTRSEEYLEYDTGHFLLYVNRDLNTQPPIPSFTVKDIVAAKQSLMENGCIILRAAPDALMAYLCTRSGSARGHDGGCLKSQAVSHNAAVRAHDVREAFQQRLVLGRERTDAVAIDVKLGHEVTPVTDEDDLVLLRSLERLAQEVDPAGQRRMHLPRYHRSHAEDSGDDGEAQRERRREGTL